LQWAVERTLSSDSPLEEALRIYREDMETTRAIGEHGASIVEDGILSSHIVMLGPLHV